MFECVLEGFGRAARSQARPRGKVAAAAPPSALESADFTDVAVPDGGGSGLVSLKGMIIIDVRSL